MAVPVEILREVLALTPAQRAELIDTLLSSLDMFVTLEHMREKEKILRRKRPNISTEFIENFCRKHHIIKLAVFGSYLRNDFGPESDIDFLVEFDRNHTPGLLDIAGMEIELSEAFDGRKVDLRTPQDLSPYFRGEVVAHAEVRYAEG